MVKVIYIINSLHPCRGTWHLGQSGIRGVTSVPIHLVDHKMSIRHWPWFDQLEGLRLEVPLTVVAIGSVNDLSSKPMKGMCIGRLDTWTQDWILEEPLTFTNMSYTMTLEKHSCEVEMISNHATIQSWDTMALVLSLVTSIQILEILTSSWRKGQHSSHGLQSHR